MRRCAELEGRQARPVHLQFHVIQVPGCSRWHTGSRVWYERVHSSEPSIVSPELCMLKTAPAVWTGCSEGRRQARSAISSASVATWEASFSLISPWLRFGHLHGATLPRGWP